MPLPPSHFLAPLSIGLVWGWLLILIINPSTPRSTPLATLPTTPPATPARRLIPSLAAAAAATLALGATVALLSPPLIPAPALTPAPTLTFTLATAAAALLHTLFRATLRHRHPRS